MTVTMPASNSLEINLWLSFDSELELTGIYVLSKKLMFNILEFKSSFSIRKYNHYILFFLLKLSSNQFSFGSRSHGTGSIIHIAKKESIKIDVMSSTYQSAQSDSKSAFENSCLYWTNCLNETVNTAC